MVKVRVAVSRATARAVLDEFRYRCALCGADNPQLHHMDENPANNDPANLIPLCPNCHLNDQHDPTRAIDPAKLRLFRRYRDPALLRPEFHPLFGRVHALETVAADAPIALLEQRVAELIEFVAALEMGAFYAMRMRELLSRPHYLHFALVDAQASETARQAARVAECARYRAQVAQAQQTVEQLVIELLRYQRWAHG